MKKNATAKALVMSVLSLMLCLSMLVGTTFAWFTDSVTSGVNKIVAGNLDIVVEYNIPNQDGTVDETKWKDLQGADSLFSGDLWEPGHTEYVYLRVKNVGSLSLNYKVLVSPVFESKSISVKDGKELKLSKYLRFATTTPSETLTTYSDRKAVQDAIGDKGEDLTKGMAEPGSIKAKGADQYMALAVYMPEEIGNEANHRSDAPAPFIELGITVVATQMMDEEDSFGNDYDEDADLSPDNTGADIVQYEAKMPVSVNTPVERDPETGAILPNDNLDVDETGITVKTEDGKASVFIPAGQVDADASNVGLQAVETRKPNDFTVGEGQSAKHYDVTPTIDGEPVANLEELPETEPDTYYVAKIPTSIGLQDVALYHENVKLDKDAPAQPGNEWYTYDSETGIITAHVKHFSMFNVTFKAVAELGGKYYGTLEEAVKLCPKGETVNLLCDITESPRYDNSIKWKVAIMGLKGTLDGNGHTITLPEGVRFLDSLFSGACIRNVTFDATRGLVVNAWAATFENVKVTGSISVGNNSGAFVYYGKPGSLGTLKFTNCEMAAKMTGAGASNNYNAAFVGYGMGYKSSYRFDNCKITGSLSCGVAALFLGNDSQLKTYKWKLEVNDFTVGKNAEIRNTLTNGERIFNGIVAAYNPNGKGTVTIDGVDYVGGAGYTALVDAKNEKWPTLFKYGPEDTSLALTKNEDGTFTITPAATAGVTKYVVSAAVYASYIPDGTIVQQASETINVADGMSYVTALKDLQFVDQKWVDAHPEATKGELAGNTTYTLDGTTYYMVKSPDVATFNGTPKSAQIYSVTAYDSNGNIVASATLS